MMGVNLFQPIESPWLTEVFQTLAAGDGVRIERIVTHGLTSAEDHWYEQEDAEWVAVLSGWAVLQFEDEIVELKPGDNVCIPAGRRHRVASASPDEPTIWLAVHFRERDETAS